MTKNDDEKIIKMVKVKKIEKNLKGLDFICL